MGWSKRGKGEGVLHVACNFHTVKTSFFCAMCGDFSTHGIHHTHMWV